MPCVKFQGANGSVGIVCFNNEYTVMVNGKPRRWELHYFGPIPLHNRTGDPLKNAPPEFYEAVKKHPAYRKWRRKVDAEIAAEQE